MSSLQFDDVSVRYGGRTVLDRVSLSVPENQIMGLVGESGSGKSTLVRAAVGLVPLAGGRILLDGEPVRRRGRRRPVQLVFQDPFSSLNPRLSIGQSIAEAFPERLRRGPRAAEVSRLLELVHLDPSRATDAPSRLSGGQRQRVAIARALAGQPEVILADEITSALDVSVQGAVLNLIREMQRESGLTVLFVSHNLAVVRYLATHVAVMAGGRIVEQGPTAQVFSAPASDYTSELLTSIPSTGGARQMEEARDICRNPASKLATPDYGFEGAEETMLGVPRRRPGPVVSDRSVSKRQREGESREH